MENNKSRISMQEEEIVRFWRENNIFEKSIEQRPETDQYVFYDGPPFATGLPHYGHILSSVTKDLFPRYQTMKGKRVRRRWGWDCHGLPIETLVEKELEISGKKDIEDKVGIKKFNQTARSMVLNYAKEWKKTIERIGRWVEFDDSYKTMDTSFMESVWWALKKLWNDNLIYEGRKVLMYCPRCETPVSNAEISMDNSYKNVTDLTLIAKFKLKKEQKVKGVNLSSETFIVAWTTTPWTLPANVALAVGGEIKYSIVKEVGSKEYIILATDLIEKVFEGIDIELIASDINGRELVGIEYEPLYSIKKASKNENVWKIVEADFVTTGEGTGVVHIAVIYGEDDFNLGLRLNLPQVPLLDASGHFNSDAPEFIQKKYFKSAQKEIISDLESRGLILKKSDYTHSYPFCWRCDSPLIYNAVSAWFINIQKDKQKLISLNEKINWYPEYLKYGRFLNILQTAPDWNISRNRYWATPLPFWKCDKCQKSICIESIDELAEKSTNFTDVYPDFDKSQKGEKLNDINFIDLHRPYIDNLIIKCSECGGEMHRIPEVIDCWVESSSMPFAEWHYPFENKQEFENRYPAQFIGEYISQTRAWFYYMHVVGSLIFDDISFENVVSTGVILDEKGEKMSKSKKNFPNPSLMIDLYGADTLRFYIMSSVVMQAENLYFSEREMREVYNKVINITLNVLSFYNIYKSADHYEFDYARLGLMDKYILSRQKKCLDEVEKSLDSYDTVKACREVRNFIDELSTWWLRRSRERFRSDNVEDSRNSIAVLRYILVNLSKIMAPIVPFTSEIIWKSITTADMPESVHLSDWPEMDSLFENDEIEKKMFVAKKIVEMGHSLRATNSLRVRQPISKVSWNFDFGDHKKEFTEIILQELNVQRFAESSEFLDPKDAVSENIKVTIDAHLDDDLIAEGDCREIIRAIQDKRKKSGFKPGDLKEVTFYCDNQTRDLVENKMDELSKATSLSRLNFSDKKPTLDLPSVKTSKGTISFEIK